MTAQATYQEAQRAYRQALRNLHPDRHPEWTAVERTAATDELMAVQEAWQILQEQALARVKARGQLAVPIGFCSWPKPHDPWTMREALRYAEVNGLHDAVALVALSGDFAGLVSLADGDVWRLDAYDQPVTDEQLALLSRFHKLQMLDLSGTDITDSGLTHLSGLRHLDDLNLCDTDVSDAGLFHLSALDELSVLNLRGTNVRGAGLSHIEDLPELRQVALPRGIARAWRRHLARHRPEIELV